MANKGFERENSVINNLGEITRGYFCSEHSSVDLLSTAGLTPQLTFLNSEPAQSHSLSSVTLSHTENSSNLFIHLGVLWRGAGFLTLQSLLYPCNLFVRLLFIQSPLHFLLL